jgi:hypothetical protein
MIIIHCNKDDNVQWFSSNNMLFRVVNKPSAQEMMYLLKDSTKGLNS